MSRTIHIIIGILLFSCTGKNDKADVVSDAPEYIVQESENVDLSSFQKDDEGFIILFDGKTSKGWRGYGMSDLPPKWEVSDDCLALNQNGKRGGDIIFNYQFRNFELEVDWRIDKAGNSGIFYLGQEIKTKDPTSGKYKFQPIYLSAPEYQLLDNDNHPDADLGKNHNRKSGSLYDIIPADPQTCNPYNEWNKARIVVNKGNVTHWLNGTKVVEYSFIGQQWIELLQSSKFGQMKWPLAFELMKDCGGKNHEGYIGLQDNGDNVSFKNIRIKILS